MLRAIVCATESDAASDLERVLSKSGRFSQIRHVEASLLEAGLEQELKDHPAQVVFLQTDGSLSALRLGRRIEEAEAHPLAVAFGQPVGAEVLLQLMRAGVCEYLSTPVRGEAVAELVSRIERRRSTALAAEGVASSEVFSFLPAKPGVGASTVAVNTSIAIAERVNSPVLLMDLDFSAGVVAFLFNIRAAFNAQDAIDRADILDEEMLTQLVTKEDNLHVLTAPDAPPASPLHFDHFNRLLQVARRQYRTVCLDLSGLLEEFSLGVLAESEKIYLVCTSETSVLHVTRRRLLKLTELGLRERAGIVLNRWDPHSELSASQIEKLLGAPVVATIANDYSRVQQAIKSGSHINPETRLGSDILRLAGSIGRFEVPAGPAPGIKGWASKLRALWKSDQPGAEPVVEKRLAETGEEKRDSSEPTLLSDREMTAALEACSGGKAASHSQKFRCQMVALVMLLRYTRLRLKQAILVSEADIKENTLRLPAGEFELPDAVLKSLQACPRTPSGHFFANPRDRRAATHWRSRLEHLQEQCKVPGLAARLDLDGSLKANEAASSLQCLSDVLARAQETAADRTADALSE